MPTEQFEERPRTAKIATIIIERGRPMHVQEILTALDDPDTDRKQLVATLSKYHKRRKKFVRVAFGIYDVIGRTGGMRLVKPLGDWEDENENR